MSGFVLGAIAGVVFKVLVPMPAIDDRIRAAWAWLWSKVSG